MEDQGMDLPDYVDSQEECAPSSQSGNSPEPGSYPEQFHTWAAGSPEENAHTSKEPEDPVATIDEVSYSWPHHPYINVEDIGKYRRGGLHPIRLGDLLGDNDRFRVVHKLGYGHFSTVWLCFDNQKKLWRGVKVLCAEESVEDSPELRAMRYFEGLSAEYMSDNHIGLPLGHFWLTGPNGRHLCLILPLLGPRIRGNDKEGYDDQLWFLKAQNPDIYTDVAFQVTQGLNVLHSRGLCHGDLRPANILLQYDRKAYRLSEAEIMGMLDEPEDYEVRLSPGKLLPAGIPPYLVAPADQSSLRSLLSGKISIVDFGLSYPIPSGDCSLPKPEIGTPCGYAAPEILFFGAKASAGIPTDVWALAVTICDLECMPMMLGSFVQIVFRALESLLGPYPEPYRTAWLEGYSEIIGRWDAGWDNEVDMRKGWDQRIGSKYDNPCPVTMSRERFAGLRQQRIDDSGFTDPFEGQIAHETRQRVSPSEATDSLYGWPSQGEYIRSRETSGADIKSSIAENLQPQNNEVAESSLQAEADRTGRAVAISEETKDKPNLNEPQRKNHTPGGEEEREKPPSILTSAQYDAVRRELYLRYKVRLSRSALINLLQQEPTARRENDAAAGSDSHSECPTDEDSLLDVCEPTRPHPADVLAANPPPPLPRLAPGETLKFYTDQSGARYRLSRMSTDRVVTLADLLRRMMKYDPANRIDTVAVLRHAWFGDRWRTLRDADPGDDGSALDLEYRRRVAHRRRRESAIRRRRETAAQLPLRRSIRLANQRTAARDRAAKATALPM
ncbi:hypothetical protein DL766_005876 [Monosporascus sp. MC13-8B]|uniref:EKC/KEOPS complex subunit BUD32 n=1 Tax=Monosporascus cannonballus TaxID=155416 RepID=A0ABY0GWG0_9PEZI|nr:hypothetical protein DL762_009767 [Monosporascus cannonballus]RYO77452.1 hypothetical protein DL763_009973 [Monosporascus cannonballus]RYP28445.1 hypothetical protein DL766_005876 [Monosporascus sp. MC13-8B]